MSESNIIEFIDYSFKNNTYDHHDQGKIMGNQDDKNDDL